MQVRGPVGDVEYHGRGRLTYKEASFQVTHINMMGRGTGITPLYQVIKVRQTLWHSGFMKRSVSGSATCQRRC
jgi:hypothetical protein